MKQKALILAGIVFAIFWLGLLFWIGIIAMRDSTFASGLGQNLAASAMEATVLAIALPLVLYARDRWQQWQKRPIFVVACFRASNRVLDAGLRLAGLNYLPDEFGLEHTQSNALKGFQDQKIEALENFLKTDPRIRLSERRWNHFQSDLDQIADALNRVFSSSESSPIHRIILENLEALIAMSQNHTVRSFSRSLGGVYLDRDFIEVLPHLFELLIAYAKMVDDALLGDQLEYSATSVGQQWGAQVGQLRNRIRYFLWGSREAKAFRKAREQRVSGKGS